MRTLVLFFVLALAVSSGVSAQKRPDYDLTTLDGKRLDQETLTGKVLVIDFWATWCGPCKVTLPRFQDLYEAYREHDGVVFLLVNPGMNDSVEDAREYLLSNELHVPAYWDERGRLARQFGIRALPTTMVLDPNGELALWQEGALSGARYEWSLRNAIDTALAKGDG